MWYIKERADLKVIHDKNSVLTDDELVVVRDSKGTQNMHAYVYK